MLDAQIPEVGRRRSTFYVSLTEGEAEQNGEECRSTKSAKRSLLAGLFRSPSGLDLGRNRSNSAQKGISSLESLNKKLDYSCDEDLLNKTAFSLSSFDSESDYSHNSLESCHKEDSSRVLLAKRVKKRDYYKRNSHLLRNSLENCSKDSTPLSKIDLSRTSSDCVKQTNRLRPFFDLNKSPSFDADKNVLSPKTKQVSKRTSVLHLEDSVPKYSPKCVTLPNNLSAKTCLDFGEKKAASRPREIALSPQEPPGRRLVGFSFIRRTHSTKITRSPSLLKALTSRCVDDGQVQKKEERKEENRRKLIDDEDQAILSGKVNIFIAVLKLILIYIFIYLGF